MPSRQHILLIDDDDLLRSTLTCQLQKQASIESVETASTGQAGLSLAENKPYDTILLDIDLPDMDGRDVCRGLRHKGIKCPILMLTAAVSDDDTITGLEAGADDYVTKPFRLAVLLARIKAQARQHLASDNAHFFIGPYSFIPASKMLTHTETEHKIRLTEKETAILKYLYIQNKIVDKDTLLNDIWGYNPAVNSHTLETHIYRLRKKTENCFDDTPLLVTEGGGYRLIR